MGNTSKKSVRFIQLLPFIYEKILVEGLIYKDICKWLTKEKNLDMSPDLLSSYIKRYGDLPAAIQRYTKTLEQEQDHFFIRSSVVKPSDIKRDSQITTTNLDVSQTEVLHEDSSVTHKEILHDRNHSLLNRDKITDKRTVLTTSGKNTVNQNQ